MSRVFAGRPLGLALVLLTAAVSFAQSAPAPAPATPAPATPATPAPASPTQVAPTPQPPPPPAKTKKKKKVDAPAQPAPTGELFAVTIKATSFGGPAGGIVSPAQIRINSTAGQGGSVTGETDYSGEFHTKLAAGDYNLMVEYASSVAAQQTIHVSKTSNNLFQVNIPPRGPI